MSNHKNLVFFNKEGDYLNFNYSEDNDRFEGDILFHENSTDTYKTYGLYMMENIPSFEFGCFHCKHKLILQEKLYLFEHH